MPSDNKPSGRRRDPTGAMIGAAMRASYRNRANSDSEEKGASGGSLMLTTLVLIVVLIGTLALVMTYGPQ